MSEVSCIICDKKFETERQLHGHLKIHKLRVAEYYQTYYPRFDPISNKLIKFKSKEYYFKTNFNSRKNMLTWLDKQPKEKAKDYLSGIILQRIKEKKIKYSPCQVELRSLMVPSAITYDKYFGDYNKFCKGLGLENKYIKIKKIIMGETYDEKYKIYIDTREQKPLKFDYPVEVRGLKFGDYALSDKNLTCNCYIERKSLADFISTLSVANYERFRREIERAEENEANLVVLVEETLSNALKFKFLPHISKKIRATPEYIFHNVRKIIQDYPSVQFLFVDGRKEAVRVTKKIFFSGCLYKDIDLQKTYDEEVL